ncbi:MAG: hypothetical protein ACVCEJ_10210 [Candidatus Izemoplasmataceae bacterium]
MKKYFMVLLSLLIVLSLSACFNYRDIEKNFEDAGYTYSEESSFIVKSLLNEFEDDGIEVTIHAFNKDVQVAVVIEFENEEDLEESLENNSLLISLMSDFDQEELIRKEYIVIPIAITEEGEQQIIDTFHE